MLLGLYLAIVLVFACCYWAVWQKVPDAFIVHDEFNQFPTAELWQDLGLTGEPEILPSMTNELPKLPEGADLRTAIVDWHQSKVDGLAHLASLNRRIAEARALRDEAATNRTKARNAIIDQFKKQEIGLILAEFQRISNDIVILEARFPSTNDLRSAKGEFQIATNRGNLAKAQGELAKRELETYSKIDAQPLAFDDAKLLATYLNANDAEISLEKEFDSLGRENRRLNLVGYDLLRQRGKTVHGRLGFFDFIYFSLGVSTTTTFGDIIPNSLWARALVTFQLLFCTIVIGILISHIGEATLRKPFDDK